MNSACNPGVQRNLHVEHVRYRLESVASLVGHRKSLKSDVELSLIGETLQTSMLALRETFLAYTSPQKRYNIEAARAARMYGTWTMLSSVVRIYAALTIEDQHMYSLAVSTYAIAVFHFAVERYVYGAQDSRTRWALRVASGSLVWMLGRMVL